MKNIDVASLASRWQVRLVIKIKQKKGIKRQKTYYSRTKKPQNREKYFGDNIAVYPLQLIPRYCHPELKRTFRSTPEASALAVKPKGLKSRGKARISQCIWHIPCAGSLGATLCRDDTRRSGKQLYYHKKIISRPK